MPTRMPYASSQPDSRLEIVAQDGRLDLIAPGMPSVRLRGLRPQVVYSRGGRRETWRPDVRPAGDGFETASTGGLSMRLQAQQQGSGLVVRAVVRNAGNDPVRLARIAPLALDDSGDCQIGSRTDRWSIFRQGYQSWTGTRSFRADDVDRDPMLRLLRIGLIDIRNPSPQARGQFRSDMFAAVKNLQSGEVLLAGFLTCRAAFGGLEVYVHGARCTRFALALDYDEIPLEPGEELMIEPMWLAAGTSEHILLSGYAAAVGDAQRARVPVRNPVGWCSWYYYFTEISENRVLQNLGALNELRPLFPCDYVQVDDGYQAAIGDWLSANEKFPRGMAWLAEQIRAAGFDAGIWTAPFIARSGSRLLADHPDWFVKNRRARPRFALYNPMWGRWGNCYALDTTHPEALDWLRQTFRTLAREWGYRVLKIDFLFAAALPGLRHDARATRAVALRRGLEAVREGAGEDAFLLGCGCPLGPAIGVVDAMRIGPDVAPYWSNAVSRVACRDLHGVATKHAIRNTLTRAFLHRQWWLNDPDGLMVRDTKTQLTEEEVRSLATVIAATDGMIVLSDRVERLSAERRDLLQRALDLSGGRAEVVDLMDADVPELVIARATDHTVVAVFNFSDETQRKKINLATLGVPTAGAPTLAEWWTGASVSVVDGTADVGEIPPHGCRVLVLPVMRPG